MSYWLIEKYPLFAFEYKMSHFCNAMGCEGHSNSLRYISADYPKRFYYIFKRKELEEWFLCICRENRLICSCCENLVILLGAINLSSRFCGRFTKSIFQEMMNFKCILILNAHLNVDF